jgi:hypothetical protein
MFQHQRFYVAGVLMALIAAPSFSFAADSTAATQKSKPQKTVPYRAATPTEKFTSDVSKVTMEVTADGSRIYHMNGEGMQSVTAHIGADGKLVMECTDNVEKAMRSANATGNVHEK